MLIHMGPIMDNNSAQGSVETSESSHWFEIISTEPGRGKGAISMFSLSTCSTWHKSSAISSSILLCPNTSTSAVAGDCSKAEKNSRLICGFRMKRKAAIMPGGRIISGGIATEPIFLQSDIFLLSITVRMTKRVQRLLQQKHEKVESHSAVGSVVITLKSHAHPQCCMIHAPIAVADGQYAENCYDWWGPKDLHALLPWKCDVFFDGKGIAQEPTCLPLEATLQLAQHWPSMKARCPTDQPNKSHANVNIAGIDHSEIVDAVTDEYVAFCSH